VTRRAGDRWLARGPLEYVPPAEVTVLERRRAVALADNEGIYVRDIRSGKVPAARPRLLEPPCSFLPALRPPRWSP